MDSISKRKRTSDDEGWSCIHCTLRNEPKAFKCKACQIQRGTSTRQAGLNAQIIAQQKLEELLAGNRRKQQRCRTRNPREPSLSSFPPSPSVPTTSSLSSTSLSSSRESIETSVTSLSTLPSTSSYIAELIPILRRPESPTPSTSRMSEMSDLLPDASHILPIKGRRNGFLKKGLFLAPEIADDFVSAPVRKRGPSKKRQKVVKTPAMVHSVPMGKTAIFEILHNGIVFEFEETIVSDTSDSDSENLENESASNAS